MDPFARAIGEVGFLTLAAATTPGAASQWIHTVFQAQYILHPQEYMPLHMFTYHPNPDLGLNFSYQVSQPPPSINTLSTNTAGILQVYPVCFLIQQYISLYSYFQRVGPFATNSPSHYLWTTILVNQLSL